MLDSKNSMILYSMKFAKKKRTIKDNLKKMKGTFRTAFPGFQFFNDVSNVILPKDYILVSFDVVSLFTNVPINLINEIVIK